MTIGATVKYERGIYCIESAYELHREHIDRPLCRCR